MKRTVRVTIEKEIEIDIADECLTEEAIKEFESYMFSLSDFSSKTKVEHMFEYAARMCFDSVPQFVEGIGEAVPDNRTGYYDGKTRMSFHVVSEDIETETIAEGSF